MTTTQILSSVLSLVAGVGVFMVACSTMSSNLETLSSDRLKQMFARVSGSKLAGVGIGALATAMIQSSGATTVMIIGFVNAGIIPLSQAATIIYGGEIGTTITGQIAALGVNSGNALPAALLFSAFAGIGAFISLFAKKDKTKTIGGALSGFGMVFVGLELMSAAMADFAKMDGLTSFFASIKNTWLLIVAGALLTALIQSSSAMTSIAIAMVAAGLVSLEQGIYLTLGANVGTCVSGLMAGMTGGANAKRTSLIQFVFNAGGVVLLAACDSVAGMLTGHRVAEAFELMFPGHPHTQLAMFHTVFNIASVILVLPFSDLLVKLTQKMVKDDEDEEEYLRLYFVDENMLRTPVIAIQQVKEEIVNMGRVAMENFDKSLDILSELDFRGEEQFRKNEKLLDYLNVELVRFIVKLSQLPLSEKDHVYLATTFHTITDFERIGDYAENAVEYAETLRDTGERFTDDAIGEIRNLRRMVDRVYEKVMAAYASGDRALVRTANVIEEQVDDFTAEMERNHLRRLSDGKCSPLAGAQFLSLASNAERVSDHLINVADEVEKWL